MNTAIVGLLSAVIVALITQAGAWMRDRKSHAEKKEDGLATSTQAILDKIDDLSQKVDDLSYKVEQTDAKQSRVRILLFCDELLHNQKHTREHFRQILDDVDVYEKFCEDHPDFKNGYAKSAMNHIRSVYERIKDTDDFLN